VLDDEGWQGMTVGIDVRARCSWAGAEALRQGLRLAAKPIGTCRTGALLLRGSPSLVRFVAGWLSAEFPPQVVTGHALSGVTPLSVGGVATGWAAQHADQILTAALKDCFGPDYHGLARHPIGDQCGCEWRVGLLQAARHLRRYAAHTSDIAYGPGGRENLLDIWRRPGIPQAGRRAPVLVQIPGGGWVVNGKRGQAYPLMGRMVELGWICVSIDYSKSPRRAWPAHIIDVKRALAWVRDNIADYGGDPDFIAVTGGSAGAHLASLAALTANDEQLQPGFEKADTTQAFCAALREAGGSTMCYAELPNAHHAFDTVATVRSQLVANAVADFFGVVYRRYLRSRGSTGGANRASVGVASG
jgi:acetyl esterase/lipase